MINAGIKGGVRSHPVTMATVTGSDISGIETSSADPLVRPGIGIRYVAGSRCTGTGIVSSLGIEVVQAHLRFLTVATLEDAVLVRGQWLAVASHTATGNRLIMLLSGDRRNDTMQTRGRVDRSGRGVGMTIDTGDGCLCLGPALSSCRCMTTQTIEVGSTVRVAVTDRLGTTNGRFTEGRRCPVGQARSADMSGIASTRDAVTD